MRLVCKFLQLFWQIFSGSYNCEIRLQPGVFLWTDQSECSINPKKCSVKVLQGVATVEMEATISHCACDSGCFGQDIVCRACRVCCCRHIILGLKLLGLEFNSSLQQSHCCVFVDRLFDCLCTRSLPIPIGHMFCTNTSHSAHVISFQIHSSFMMVLCHCFLLTIDLPGHATLKLHSNFNLPPKIILQKIFRGC